MEFLRGALSAGLWGCLVSVGLALLFVMGTFFLVAAEWDSGAFKRGMVFTTFMLAAWVVPVSVILRLVRAVVRRPVRVEGGSGRATAF